MYITYRVVRTTDKVNVYNRQMAFNLVACSKRSDSGERCEREQAINLATE